MNLSMYHLRAIQRRNRQVVPIMLGIFLLFVSFLYYEWHVHIRQLNSLVFQPQVVQAGDTLWRLAEESGLNIDTRTLVLKIMQYNSLPDSTIKPGQVIYIPVNTSNLAKK